MTCVSWCNYFLALIIIINSPFRLITSSQKTCHFPSQKENDRHCLLLFETIHQPFIWCFPLGQDNPFSMAIRVPQPWITGHCWGCVIQPPPLLHDCWGFLPLFSPVYTFGRHPLCQFILFIGLSKKNHHFYIIKNLSDSWIRVYLSLPLVMWSLFCPLIIIYHSKQTSKVKA